jgi:hypothetical protein
LSIVVKAGAGLAAGVVAGALGLAFLPRLEPSAVQPRNAVEKPQFVVASAGVAPAPQPAATLAVATETPAAKPATPAKIVTSVVTTPVTTTPTAAPPALPAPAPSAVALQTLVSSPPAITAKPIVAANLIVAAKPIVAAKAEEMPAPVVGPRPAPSAPVSAPAASPDAARWSVRGLVALARGDISSARLFLARAAEAGDARAWVALADTFDPAMLTKFGVVFAPGDVQRAKDCLVKAVAAGVVVPKDRLAALDQGERQVR